MPMRAISLIAFLVAAEDAAFIAICLTVRPMDEATAAVYLSWMTIPALTAAICSVNHRWSPLAIIFASVSAVICWNYLLVVKGMFFETTFLRAHLIWVHTICGIGLAFLSAGYVKVLVDAVEQTGGVKQKMRILAGMKKGLSFGGIIWTFIAIAAFVFGPPVISGRGVRVELLRQQLSQRYAMIAVGLLIVGMLLSVALGAFIGLLYQSNSEIRPGERIRR